MATELVDGMSSKLDNIQESGLTDEERAFNSELQKRLLAYFINNPNYSYPASKFVVDLITMEKKYDISLEDEENSFIGRLVMLKDEFHKRGYL